MSPFTSLVISVLATIVLFGQIIGIGLLKILLFGKLMPKNKLLNKITKHVSQNYIALIFIVSAIATMGSLTLSEVLGFVPCKLCWFQRIAMYPITVMSFIALIKNDNEVKKYILPISVIGFLIAGYHILVQLFPTILECSDEVAKCSAVDFAQYGFITIPVMAFTAFALIITICLFGNKKK